jgi:replicative DNA helicase
MNLEQLILKSLIVNEEYSRKVLPFIKSEYFSSRETILLFNEVQEFISKYNSNPTYEALIINVNDKKITDEEYKASIQLLDDIKDLEIDNSNLDWLIDKTENFCKEKAVYNAVAESIQILDNKKKDVDKGAIPKLLSDALAVSFDQSVGHDYIDDYNSRYDFYHKKEEKIPFDLDFFNKITKGGLPKKSITIILAGPGSGKSLFMCHSASNCLMQGKNVLYITLEMAEERIAERIDANILNVRLDDIVTLTKEQYEKKFRQLRDKTIGNLIIKEYPTASASVVHFRTLLNELNLKKNFKPDIIYVDYMNICTSSRVKTGSNVNSYSYVKSIAEEIRGLAVEFNVPIMTATQMTRSGATNSDPSMEDVSESFGTVATADMIFALINTEEFEQINQIMVKQIKNRYSDPTTNKRFMIGIDRAKMKLYDVENSAQSNISDSGQSSTPDSENFAWNPKDKFEKKSFSGFKI